MVAQIPDVGAKRNSSARYQCGRDWRREFIDECGEGHVRRSPGSTGIYGQCPLSVFDTLYRHKVFDRGVATQPDEIKLE